MNIHGRGDQQWSCSHSCSLPLYPSISPALAFPHISMLACDVSLLSLFLSLSPSHTLRLCVVLTCFCRHVSLPSATTEQHRLEGGLVTKPLESEYCNHTSTHVLPSFIYGSVWSSLVLSPCIASLYHHRFSTVGGGYLNNVSNFYDRA